MIYDKIEKKYKQGLFSRCDEDSAIHYFSASDFDGLHFEPFEFTNSKNELLKGGFYRYDKACDDALVVFDHGFGAGHKAYMKEIELLCRHGYVVFAYDHTGCASSKGSGTPGLSGSLSDLDRALTAVKQAQLCTNKKIYCIGHSWGGFSTMNIPAYHSDVSKIAVLAGFVSLKRMLKQSFPFPLSLYIDKLYELEKGMNPTYSDSDGIEALKNSNTKALMIYSDNDTKVSKKHHYNELEKALSECDNVTLILERGKGHNPNYTKNAVALLDSFFAEYTEKSKKGLLSSEQQKSAFRNSRDWNAMTEQDEHIWKLIFDHFDR